MKEKDFIKLVLTDKSIDHKKIKSNILSEEPVQAKSKIKRRPLALMAVVCTLLLTVSAVSIPLMFNNNDKLVLPPQSSSANSEQSGETSGTEVPFESALDRKVVYRDSSEDDLDVVYPYGTIQIDYYLKKAMKDPENEDALFAVLVFYSSEKCLMDYIQDSTDPDDFEIKQALNDYIMYENDYEKLFADFKNYYEVTIPKKIDFNTIPNDVYKQISDENIIKKKQISLIMVESEKRFLVHEEEIRYLKEQVKAAKADEQVRAEVLSQLDEYLNSFKTTLDFYYAAKEKFDQLDSVRYTELQNEFFERNGLTDKEKSIKYGVIKFLLTKEEILSITVNDKESVSLYLAPENDFSVNVCD